MRLAKRHADFLWPAGPYAASRVVRVRYGHFRLFPTFAGALNVVLVPRVTLAYYAGRNELGFLCRLYEDCSRTPVVAEHTAYLYGGRSEGQALVLALTVFLLRPAAAPHIPRGQGLHQALTGRYDSSSANMPDTSLLHPMKPPPDSSPLPGWVALPRCGPPPPRPRACGPVCRLR